MADERPEESLSVQQFCVYEHISKSFYHRMRSLGYGPRELRIPGTQLVRITTTAREEWHERLTELKPEELKQLGSEFAERSAMNAAKGEESGRARNEKKAQKIAEEKRKRGSYQQRGRK